MLRAIITFLLLTHGILHAQVFHKNCEEGSRDLFAPLFFPSYNSDDLRYDTIEDNRLRIRHYFHEIRQNNLDNDRNCAAISLRFNMHKFLQKSPLSTIYNNFCATLNDDIEVCSETERNFRLFFWAVNYLNKANFYKLNKEAQEYLLFAGIGGCSLVFAHDFREIEKVMHHDSTSVIAEFGSKVQWQDKLNSEIKNIRHLACLSQRVNFNSFSPAILQIMSLYGQLNYMFEREKSPITIITLKTTEDYVCMPIVEKVCITKADVIEIRSVLEKIEKIVKLELN